MTLTDVFTAMKTQGRIHPSRIKDIQTSIQHFACALGKESPEQCQQDDFLLSTAVRKEKLDTYFMSLDKRPSASTFRNTRNNLSFLFRTAHDAGIITAPQSLPLLHPNRIQHQKLFTQTSPYRDRVLAASQHPYVLPPHAWPADIQEAWHTYAVSRQLKTRQTTLNKYGDHLSTYLGFLINIEGLSPHWDDLFDMSSLDRFIRWHSQRNQVHISTRACMVAQTLKILAAQLKHPSLPSLKDYFHDLPTPEPMHNKQDHWITLRELETIGLSLLQDAQKPVISQQKKDALTDPTYLERKNRPGLFRALQHQHALMLRLLVRIPLRSRNLREIHLDKNLYQDQHDCWHLHFRGSELKSAHATAEPMSIMSI